MEIDRRIPITSLISWAIGAVVLVSGGAVATYRLDAVAAEQAQSKVTMEALRTENVSLAGRLIRLETRMDTIIDQQGSILAELRSR